MFKVGQKVVCVDDSGFEFYFPKLIKGKIYTIREVLELHIRIMEFEDCYELRYYKRRFRPLDETFATEVLEQIKEQIEQEELVTI